MGKTAEDLRQDLEQQRESVGRDLVAIGDRVSPGRMVERRRLAARQLFTRARDGLMGARDSVSDTAYGAQSAVGGAAANVGEALAAGPRAVQSQTQGSPMAAGLVAFGVGAVAGTLLPTTRREETAVAEVQPALETAAGELAGGVDAVTATAKDHATDSAQHLKEAAQDAAETVKAEAQGAAQTVKADAQGTGPSDQQPPSSTGPLPTPS
jgi:hypothetical protein